MLTLTITLTLTLTLILTLLLTLTLILTLNCYNAFPMPASELHSSPQNEILGTPLFLTDHRADSGRIVPALNVRVLGGRYLSTDLSL